MELRILHFFLVENREASILMLSSGVTMTWDGSSLVSVGVTPCASEAWETTTLVVASLSGLSNEGTLRNSEIDRPDKASAGDVGRDGFLFSVWVDTATANELWIAELEGFRGKGVGRVLATSV